MDIFSLGHIHFTNIEKQVSVILVQGSKETIISSQARTHSNGISAEARHMIEKMIRHEVCTRPEADYRYQHCIFWNHR